MERTVAGTVDLRFISGFLGHENYVRALLGLSKVQGRNSYPGFSTDPFDGFRHLREDLERFGEVFLKGSDAEFRSLKDWIDVHPKGTVFEAYIGDRCPTTG